MVGTPIPSMAGGGNLALDSRSSMVEQEEAREDRGHEASKIQALASVRLGHQILGAASSSMDKYG